MNPDSIHQELESIFHDVIDDTIVLSPELTADDVEGWDSVAHVNLLFAIEETFEIEFTQREMASMANVGELEAHIRRKTGGPST